MEDGRSFFTSARLPIATAVLATGIFIADTVTRVDIAVPVLYVAVVLLSARFCKPLGVAMVAAGCAALTIFSYVITRNTGPLIEGMVNALISLGAIAVITPLVLRAQSRELALRRSEKDFRDLLENIPAVAFSARPDGLNEFQSRAWFEYSGLRMEDSLGNGWQATVHPDDLRSGAAKWAKDWEGSEPFENEIRYRSKTGEYRWFLARVVPLRDESGKVLKWFGAVTDIEDRKRAESLLAGEKRILEMVAKGDSLEQILDALCRLVEEQVSGSLASISLFDGDRLRRGAAPSLPKDYTDAIHGTGAGPSVGFCAAARRGEQVIVEDIATDPSWANYRDVALQYSLRACWSTPIFSSRGKVIASFAMHYREPRRPGRRDQELIEQITHLTGVVIERNQTHAALRRSEAYLAEAQRLTHTGSYAYDGRTNTFPYWSEEHFRIWGFDPRQAPPDGETLLQRVHPEDREMVRQRSVKSMRERSDYIAGYRIVLPDATLKYIEGIGHHVSTERGGPILVIGTHIDVTERKRAEEERERLRQLEANLAHMNRVSVMGEMSASLAHELKQPMAAAVMNAEVCLELLKLDQIDIQELSDATSAILRSVKRGADIIDRLRSLSRKGNPERELVDVNEVIREIGALLQSEARMSSVAVGMELAEEAPQVAGDRVQLQQVVMNLMLNALESMKEKGGDLLVRSELTQTGEITISVSDTGIGLPEGNEERIFDAFFTTKSQGTGMGLAISRSIVESHGGRLSARRNAGPGATFYIELPQQVGEAA